MLAVNTGCDRLPMDLSTCLCFVPVMCHQFVCARGELILLIHSKVSGIVVAFVLSQAIHLDLCLKQMYSLLANPGKW